MVTLINKIECKYQTNLNFAQIMRACLCVSKDRKVFSSKVCIKLQCDRICFSGSKQYSLKVENIQITWEYHFSLFRNLSSAVVMQILYITNVFFFLIMQYFIDTLEGLLKPSQSFWNTLLYPKMVFILFILFC